MVSQAPASTTNLGFWKTFFLVAALYDGILGAVFFLFYNPLFHALNIQLPSNTSYIHITTAYIFVQGLSYWFVFRDPIKNVDIVKVGIVYKVIYSGLAFYYLAIGQLLSAVFAWLGLVDVIFLVLFIWFLVQARSEVRTR